jgi:putative ATP-dependent endonuclease of OLD family
LVKLNGTVIVKQLSNDFNIEDLQALQREVMRFRGELLFSNAIILVEGVTEEQFVPAMFEHYFGFSAFSKGVNCISVAGQNYAPFIKMACSFGVPICVVSDNDNGTKKNVDSQISNIKEKPGLELNSDEFQIYFLKEGNDIEAELVWELDITEELIEALALLKTKGSGNQQHLEAIKKDLDSNEDALLKTLRCKKASYAGFLADVICRNPLERNKDDLVPNAFKSAFNQIENWIS